MSDTLVMVWFCGGVIAGIIALFAQPPCDPFWPDETTPWPGVMFAFVLWPIAIVGFAALLVWAGYIRLRE